MRWLTKIKTLDNLILTQKYILMAFDWVFIIETFPAAPMTGFTLRSNKLAAGSALAGWFNVDSTAKSQKWPSSVIPAKAGIQSKHILLDPGFRRGDDFETFRSGLNATN